MRSQPFHHGNLPTVLLDHAAETLRSRGIDALSLRELARQAGVSHSAPRNHFPDRQALLDALAERGFDQLTELAQTAMDDDDDYEAMFQRVATSYVRFAVSNAALLELMFAAKADDPPVGVLKAAERLFAAFDQLIGRGLAAGYFQQTEPDRVRLLIVATMQGTATLVASRRITPEQGSALIADATSLILHSPGIGLDSETTLP